MDSTVVAKAVEWGGQAERKKGGKDCLRNKTSRQDMLLRYAYIYQLEGTDLPYYLVEKQYDLYSNTSVIEYILVYTCLYQEKSMGAPQAVTLVLEVGRDG